MGISFLEWGVGMWQLHIDPLDSRTGTLTQ